MEKNQGISKVAMFILMQKDLEKAVEFYKNLGLNVLFHLKDRWAELELGEVKLGLCPTDQELPDRHTGIVLQVGDVKAFCEEKKDILELVSEPVEKVHGIMASFKDPSGSILDLYQPTPEKVQEVMRKAKEEGGCCKKEGSSTGPCCKGN